MEDGMLRLSGHASEDDVRRIRLMNIESGAEYARKVASGEIQPFKRIRYGIGGGLRSNRQQRRVYAREDRA